jgi:hypothetical protein
MILHYQFGRAIGTLTTVHGGIEHLIAGVR